jgi:hypothetical protein
MKNFYSFTKTREDSDLLKLGPNIDRKQGSNSMA